ncbi:hypothetical protein [Stenotrophomonas sp. AS012628]|uniref:hypothetical protein n=1 Tax=Stenotrophomonas sp. AS012628 TaxID=2597656 RepID=UPI00177FC7F8|nr:hypothetical protein [Stenotrophomonas sp. AS012628]
MTAFPCVPAAMQTFTLPRGEDLKRADASPPSKFTGFVVGPFFCHHVYSDDEKTMMGDSTVAELGEWQVTHVETGACVQRGLPTHYRAIWLAEKLSAFQDFTLPSFQAIKEALAPQEEEIASLRWEAKNGNCQRACNFSFTGVQS